MDSAPREPFQKYFASSCEAPTATERSGVMLPAWKVYNAAGWIAGALLRIAAKRFPAVFWNEVARAYRRAHLNCPAGAPCEVFDWDKAP